MVEKAKHKVRSTVTEKAAPVVKLANDCEDIYNEYRVYKKMSSKLEKISEKCRKNEDVDSALNKMESDLKEKNFESGRGSKKLTGTKTIYYMRSGGPARMFYRYTEENNAIEIVAECDKNSEEKVIKNLKKNYD